jgi:aspartate/methionine/tyrosine aminotransferase
MSEPTTPSKNLAPPRAASRRAATMPRSAIREIMALAAGREGIIHLELGEPDFVTPLPIIEAGFEAARKGFTKYGPNAGLPSLRRLVAERLSGRWNQDVTVERVVITTGAIGALHAALMSVTDAGDEILVPDPGWPNYEAIVHLAGATPVRFVLPAERGFVPDPVQIARLAATSRREQSAVMTGSS